MNITLDCSYDYLSFANIDKNSVDYIKNYGAMPNVSKIDPVKKEKKDGNYTGDDLFYAVEKGLKNEILETPSTVFKPSLFLTV